MTLLVARKTKKSESIGVHNTEGSEPQFHTRQLIGFVPTNKAKDKKRLICLHIAPH
jgi:hypothetical protein